MAQGERTGRVQYLIALYREMRRSTVKALEESAIWNDWNNRVALGNGGGKTPEARMIKKDHLEMKDAMNAYTWHAGNASFCAQVIHAESLLRPIGDLEAMEIRQGLSHG